MASLQYSSACVLEVVQMYKKMGWEVEKDQPYKDAWNMRRLVSYAHRRAKDCKRRGQVPRDF